MPGQGVSDAALEVQRVCRHGIGFHLGVQLDVPLYNVLRPRHPAEGKPPPRLYRLIQAASPPPTRGGNHWKNGLRVDGEPLDPDKSDWRTKGVTAESGIPSLDQPAPRAIVLNEWVTLPFTDEQTMPVTGGDQTGFLSVKYFQPPDPHVGVNYYGSFLDQRARHWDRLLDPGDWVAISIDRFWPPERDSADYIAQVSACSKASCILFAGQIS